MDRLSKFPTPISKHPKIPESKKLRIYVPVMQDDKVIIKKDKVYDWNVGRQN